jgi:RNA polymerase sigma factor (sigma-70 family)
VATVPADVEGPSDAELIEAVRKGTVSAYGALYERHVASAYNLARQLARSPAEADDLVSEAFAKVLDTLRGGRGPDSAFRAYLLTALRHTAYDKTRRERRVQLSDDVTTVSGVSLEAVSEEFDDTAVAGLERSMAAQAFARLPERWQAVLWHTEIEGQSPAEVAPLLGLTANGVSALAYRAREGLRQAYLQVHLAETTDRSCRAAAEKLGAWTRGGLAKREKAQVEAHLDICERCRALAAELADVNGAMRLFIAPVVLGIGAAGYLASTGGAASIASTTIVAGGAAGSAAGAVASAPRQFLGVAASGVALAAAIVLGIVAAGSEQPEIPAAELAPTQEQPPPSTTTPEPPPQQQQPPPAQQEPPQPPPPTQEPPTQEPPTTQPQEPNQPPSQTPPTPPTLNATGPNTPISLVAGGAPVDLPLTVRNSGGTVSDPVTAVLNLPAGVTAVPVDGFAAPRLLSLNGAKASTVNCPGGTGVVTCVSETGLAPGESVTLLFRLVAANTAKGGQISGIVSAGVAMRVNVTVRVEVKPAPVTDGVLLRAEADWAGLFGPWFDQVVEVKVTNSGTSSRPVTIQLDQPATRRWSSQDITCTTAGGTTCVTTAELAPGETLKVVMEIKADPWPVRSPNRNQVHVSATLGEATDSVRVTLWDCLWPTEPTKPPTQITPPTSKTPVVPPSTSSSDTPVTKPTNPTSSESTSSSEPPATTTTPPTSTESSDPGRSAPRSETSSAPPSSETPSGGLGDLLDWLLGG